MIDIIDEILAIENTEDLFELGGVEYAFHLALEQGRLSEILAKFPNSGRVGKTIEESVVHYKPLEFGWENKLLAEIQALVNLLPEGTLVPITKIVLGTANYGTDEMFALRATMGRLIKEHSRTVLTVDERSFLNDFFYGVDFTHWTKWAILLDYTDIGIRFPYILQARRNSVSFAVEGEKLIYEHEKSVKTDQ